MTLDAQSEKNGNIRPMLIGMYAKDRTEMQHVIVDTARGCKLEITGTSENYRVPVFDAFESWIAYPKKDEKRKSYGSLVMNFGILNVGQEKLDELVEIFCKANLQYSSAGPALKAMTVELRKKAEEICIRNNKEAVAQAKREFSDALAAFGKNGKSVKGGLYDCPSSLLSKQLSGMPQNVPAPKKARFW